MLSPTDIETIKNTTKEFFDKTTFEVEVEVLPEKEQTVPINLKMDEPQVLIGEGGQTLFEIQYILKNILKRKIEGISYIDLDINEYKQKKIEYLKDMARSAADDVAITKKEKELAPMPAYERRIIHMELAERADVVTESRGEGPDRHIVIKPK